MRVADHTAQMQYILNNAKALKNYLDKSNTVLTQKKFTRASQNPVDANMAMKIRKQLSNLKNYDKNLGNASDIFTVAETSLTHISTKLFNDVSTNLESIQSTKGDVEFEAIGDAIRNYAESMVKTMNVDTGERMIFGGTSNCTNSSTDEKVPFTYKYYRSDEHGTFVNYKTEAVNNINTDVNDGDRLAFKDAEGNTVTVTAKNVNGKMIYTNRNGKDVTNEITDEKLTDAHKYIPKKIQVQDTDPSGDPIFTYTDASGNVTEYSKTTAEAYWDNSVNPPVQETYSEITDNLVPKTDSNGNPVYDSDNNPVYTYKDPATGALSGEYSRKTEIKYWDNAGSELTDAAKIKALEPKMTDGPEFVKDDYGNILYKEADDTDIASGSCDIMEAYSSDSLKDMRAVVFFNGVDVSKYSDPAEYPGGKEGIYVDIGLGIKYDENGDVIKSTAMDLSLNGAKLTGCGRDAHGDSRNIIQLAFDAAWAAYNSGEQIMYKGNTHMVDGAEKIEVTDPSAMAYANRLIDKLSGGQKTVLEGITELGVKQNNIEFHLSKDKEYALNLSDRQNKTEGVDLADAITEELAAQAAYNAALRLGATAVPQSIFNFI